MRFISTRGGASPHTFSEAVRVGLAPDGGLFLPSEWPDLRPHLSKWADLSYSDLCAEFLLLFATDVDEDAFRELVARSYRRFDRPEIAPLKRLDRNTWILELFHGPTLAFKDFALQLLGNVYEHQIRRTGEPIHVLGATSGDTGAAAIHGLLGKEGVRIFILYPNGRISPLQERQMTCTGAENVFPLAVEGDFDTAQSALKEVFADPVFSKSYGLSAVNSINLARILAQCVYYLYAWLRLSLADRQRVEFVVPTGNFGNVMAGWMLRKMGMDALSFRVSTNQNDILYHAFTRGVYEVAKVSPSLAPSMDILVASNFERFLYFAANEDTARVREMMDEIRKQGKCRLPRLTGMNISATSMHDGEIPGAIRRVFEQYHYIVDPHTACAFKQHDPDRCNVVLATASPAKFPEVIREATGVDPRHPALDALKDKPIVSYPVPPSAEAIKEFIVRHSTS